MALARATVVQRVRNLLRSYDWETTSTTATTSATVAVPDGTQWAAGDIGEWSYTGTVGGERFLVQSVSANNLTVVRGYDGTTSETHTSGDRVTKNPAYTVTDIRESIDEVLNGLYPTVWKLISQTVTPDTTKKWIDSGLSSTELDDLIDVSSVIQVYNTDDLGVYGPHGLRRVWVRRNMPTGTWASGVAVRFPDGYFHTTNTVTFNYRGKITDVVSGSNYSDLDDGNSLAEAVVWLAAARLVTKRESEGLAELASEGSAKSGDLIRTGAYYESKGMAYLMRYREQLLIEVPRLPDHRIEA